MMKKRVTEERRQSLELTAFSVGYEGGEKRASDFILPDTNLKFISFSLPFSQWHNGSRAFYDSLGG